MRLPANITTRPDVFWPFVIVDFSFGLLSALFLATENWGWASVVIWLGIPPNLYFAFPAFFAPVYGARRTSTRPLPETVWLRNTGLLIFIITAAHVVAAIDPERFEAVAWLTVGGRLSAGVYWLVVVFSKPVPSADEPAAS
jgi:hypothetical protein